MYYTKWKEYQGKPGFLKCYVSLSEESKNLKIGSIDIIDPYNEYGDRTIIIWDQKMLKIAELEVKNVAGCIKCEGPEDELDIVKKMAKVYIRNL